ncbi:reverse transcriptase family protein [Halomonas koreensis]|uniref:RNA-directed DNA polymerase n=1 Tax=Halomonas koreensis TaxID=245385 RepID=A0ABU1G671_9GAMM|nr:reverse transcriptase family protein [Halomonas koreensis]MDR5868447.1 reverse transcriptase family protein [Halomonas koreensis]
MLKYTPKNRISSKASLAKTLSISESELEELLSDIEQSPQTYSELPIPKKNGTYRTVFNPNYRLKTTQQRICGRIFPHIQFPPYLFGSIKDESNPRDYFKCVQLHCGAGCLATIDIEDFFPSIDKDKIFDIFLRFFHFPERVAWTLTQICTHPIYDFLPQGAPTSPIVANLALYKKEHQLYSSLKEKGVTYTRLMDDIAISHTEIGHKIEREASIIRATISSQGFKVNEKKSSLIQRKGNSPIVLHGLRLGESQPKLQAGQASKVRSSVKHLEKLASEPNKRTHHEFRRLWHSTSGRVNLLRRAGDLRYPSLRKRLNKISPLISPKERLLLYKTVSKLENKHEKYSNRHWYKKEVAKSRYLAIIMRKSFHKEATQLLNRLHALR